MLRQPGLAVVPERARQRRRPIIHTHVTHQQSSRRYPRPDPVRRPRVVDGGRPVVPKRLDQIDEIGLERG